VLVDGNEHRVHAADLPAGLRRHPWRPRGGPVLLRDHPAQGRPRLRGGQLPGAVREHRAAAAIEGGASDARPLVVGELPAKHHITLRGPDPTARCGTRSASRGVASTVRTPSRTTHRPHTHRRGAAATHGWAGPSGRRPRAPLRGGTTLGPGWSLRAARQWTRARRCCSTPTWWSRCSAPTADDPVYVSNADGDELIYVHPRGRRRAAHAVLGELRFGPGLRVRAPGRACTASCPTGRSRSTGFTWSAAADAGCPSSGATTSASSAWTRPTATATSGGPTFVGPWTRGSATVVVKRGGRVPRL
jgi:hypothetical protein